MKIRSERGREALYIGCVYMPTDSTSVSVMDSCYEMLKEDVLSFREKGKVVLLGDFNARVGRSAQLDDVVGMFGENTCNASGNRLLSFLTEVELMICNGRKLVSEPEWTRIRPSLKQVNNRSYYNRCSITGSVRKCACGWYRYRILGSPPSMDGIRSGI